MGGSEPGCPPPRPVRARGHAARGPVPRGRGGGRGRVRRRLSRASPVPRPADRDQGPEGPRRRRPADQRPRPREVPGRGAAPLHALAVLSPHRPGARLRCGHDAVRGMGSVHDPRVARGPLARGRSRRAPPARDARALTRRGLRDPRARRRWSGRGTRAAGRASRREAGEHLPPRRANAGPARAAGEGARFRDRQDHEGG